VAFDDKSLSLRARALRRLGAITLNEQPVKLVPGAATARMLAQGVARVGLDRLPWSKALRQWRDRVMFLRRATDPGFTRDRHLEGPKSAKADLGGEEWPDLSDAALAANATDWLAPALAEVTSIAALGADELAQAMHQLLPWN